MLTCSGVHLSGYVMSQHCVHSFNVNYFICSFSDDYDNDGDDNMVLLLALESTSLLVSCSQAYKKIKYKKLTLYYFQYAILLKFF